MKRRERTRLLIELGGLVVETGLVELTDADRSVLRGIMLSAAVTVCGDQRKQAIETWSKRGASA